MTLTRTESRYSVRLAGTPRDMELAHQLRALAFRTDDRDRFDGVCTHYLIEDRSSGAPVCCFRVLPLASGASLNRSYSAQFYDLTQLAAFPGPMLELGRVCLHPHAQDPDILRLAWAALTRHVDRDGIEMLFGCSSFAGMSPAPYRAAFCLLARTHLAPSRWRPGKAAADVLEYAADGCGQPIDNKAGLQQMPPLLRTYLMMGGWVSDHAVIDAQMNTMHVFTGLEIAGIPAPRKRLLRASAQMLDEADAAR